MEWKEKRIEDSLSKNESFKSLSNERKVALGARYVMVLPEILKNKKLSPGAKYLYAWLLMFKRFDPKKRLYGKAVVSNALLEKEPGMSHHTSGARREELKQASLIDFDPSGSVEGCVYTFLVVPGEHDYCEKITKNFLYCASFKAAQKQFIISLLPHIYREVDRFRYSNKELAEKMGYSEKQVRNHMNSFKEMGLLVEYQKNRGFNLLMVMSGMSDKIDELLTEIEEKDRIIEELKIENNYLRDGKIIPEELARYTMAKVCQQNPFSSRLIKGREKESLQDVTEIVSDVLKKESNVANSSQPRRSKSGSRERWFIRQKEAENQRLLRS
ncbi:hypothetical protein [Reichenbachiella sp.]|uniref:hypothetical protein n=1 Tax=Reichenbachiella sp. TaxID=2184521 RepID=UPI003BAE7A28